MHVAAPAAGACTPRLAPPFPLICLSPPPQVFNVHHAMNRELFYAQVAENPGFAVCREDIDFLTGENFTLANFPPRAGAGAACLAWRRVAAAPRALARLRARAPA